MAVDRPLETGTSLGAASWGSAGDRHVQRLGTGNCDDDATIELSIYCDFMSGACPHSELGPETRKNEPPIPTAHHSLPFSLRETRRPTRVAPKVAVRGGSRASSQASASPRFSIGDRHMCERRNNFTFQLLPLRAWCLRAWCLSPLGAAIVVECFRAAALEQQGRLWRRAEVADALLVQAHVRSSPHSDLSSHPQNTPQYNRLPPDGAP